MDLSSLKVLRTLAFIEGCSTLVLFGIAMPLKYWMDVPMVVPIVGTIHGILFLSLAVVSILSIWRVPIGMVLGLGGVIAAVFPFGPFILDIWLKKLIPEEPTQT